MNNSQHEPSSNNTNNNIPSSKHDQERSTTTTTTTPKSKPSANNNIVPGKPSNVIYIKQLTRPFTVNQLKELLGSYGAFKNKTPHGEPYFWIDAVKSYCYVAYENEQDAERARNGLHNLRWPSSNPKTLVAGFSTMDEIVNVIENDGKAKQNGDNDSKSKDRKVSNFTLNIECLLICINEKICLCLILIFFVKRFANGIYRN